MNVTRLENISLQITFTKEDLEKFLSGETTEYTYGSTDWNFSVIVSMEEEE